MWSKLNQHLNNLLNRKKEQTPNEIVAMAIQEIEEAILAAQKACEAARKNEHRIAAELSKSKKESEVIYQKAVEATKRGDDITAKRWLTEKNSKDQHLAQYQKLHDQALASLKQLEGQYHNLKFKLEETKSKQVILAAQLENAKSQKDLNMFLSELGISDGLEQMEDDLQQLEIENQLMVGETSIDVEIDLALNTTDPSVTDVNALKQEIEAKEEQERLAEEEKRMKQVHQLFGESDKKRKALEQEALQKQQVDKQKMLRNLMDTTEDLNSEKNIVREEETKPIDIDGFFQQEKNSERDDGNWANEILQDLNQQETNTVNQEQNTKEPDDKQKKIDDFFND